MLMVYLQYGRTVNSGNFSCCHGLIPPCFMGMHRQVWLYIVCSVTGILFLPV